jgi:hypothetical protein
MSLMIFTRRVLSGLNYFPKSESWIKGIEFRHLDVPQ